MKQETTTIQPNDTEPKTNEDELSDTQINPPPPDQPTMRAYVVNQYGTDPTTTLQLATQPLPVITKTECLVRVLATSINPLDWKIMKGELSILFSTFPMVPCFDVSGIVTQVGENCKRLKVGDSVYGCAKVTGPRTMGALADFIAISERCLAKIPNNLTYLEAASFPMVGLTTIQGIGKYTKDGMKVLVLGGSGGVGSFAVQYCKAKGCQVYATCGERNVDFVTELGADRVINYKDQDWGELLAGENFDLIFDTVGGTQNFGKAEKVIKKKKGLFVTVSGDKDPLTWGNLVGLVTSWIGRNALSLVNKNAQYSHLTVSPQKGQSQLVEVRQLIEGGFIKPLIDDGNVYSFENVAEGFAKSMEGHVTGKLVVSVGDDANKKANDN